MCLFRIIYWHIILTVLTVYRYYFAQIVFMIFTEASSLCGSCSDSDSLYNLFDSYSNYKTKYCPFGCCGTSDHQHCCYNVGIIAAVIVGVVVCIVAVVTIICCCFFYSCRERPQTCGPTPAKTCGPTPAKTSGPTPAKTCSPTPGIKQKTRQTMNPNALPPTPSIVSSSNNHQQASLGMPPVHQPFASHGGVGSPGDRTLPSEQDNAFECSSYSSPVSHEIYDVNTLRQVVSLY
ncbi:unnamed protein product [Lymnaea stagnalis]|uniref:Uncharacterized protein n=1 Tax=Lymnaea stagnalis TaxID=6523 RepID=A0AAV2HFF9_LYMST